MGGTGGGIAYNKAEFIEIIERGIDASPTNEVLVEESVLGWKEYEMEVVRDKADNCIIICSIENIDPMGVHTGDSHHHRARADADRQGIPDHARRLAGGAARDRRGDRRLERAVRHRPRNGPHDRHRDEPARVALLGAGLEGDRLSRSPRSRRKLAVGYTLDEIANDITGGATPASFEPTIDYVVTKIPRFAFEKFPGAENTLTTVDEVGRRGHGDRPHLPGIAAEGAALAGDGPAPASTRSRSRASASATTRTPSAPRSARRRRTGC